MKSLLITLLSLVSLISFDSSASVVMTNTRVIYTAQETSKTIQFTNRSDTPYLMQVWTDVNNPGSTPDNADGPFLVSPVIFRIEPKGGQSARLRFTGDNLPQDRESLFYLNFAQIPPKNQNKNENKLTLIIKNRVKLFYRPASLQDKAADISKAISFELHGKNGKPELHIKNDSSYHASFSEISVIAGGKNYPLDIEMLAPKSEKSVAIKSLPSLKAGKVTLRYGLINDLGGKVIKEVSL